MPARLLQADDGKARDGSGASPQDLATADFAIVPLWRTGKKLSKIVDLAHKESVMNAIPAARAPTSSPPPRRATRREHRRADDARKASCDRHAR